MPLATMSAAEVAAFEPQQHIPAWKRFGLKLKSAPVPQSDLKLKKDQSNDKKRKLRSFDTAAGPRKHRASKSHSIAAATNTHANLDLTTLSRKKSVTFTQDTKVEDGDSVKQLFKSWVQEQQSKHPSFTVKASQEALTTPSPSTVQEAVDTHLPEAERRIKRVKKPKPQKSKASQKKDKNTAKSPVLSYLKEYCESRQTWKFNKNHQSHLVKHAFDLDVIPSNYVHYLYVYVRNLQGGVRTRLRDTALKILVEDEEAGPACFPDTMPSAEQLQRDHDIAKNEYVAGMTAHYAPPEMGYEEGVLLNLSDFAMKKRVAKRSRASRVMNALPDDGGAAWRGESQPKGEDGANGNHNTQKKLRMNDGTTQHVVRKRKQRTSAVDSESSSTSATESSSSEADSEGSTSSDKTVRQTKGGKSSSSANSTSSSTGEGDETGSGNSEEGSDESSSEGDETDRASQASGSAKRPIVL